MSGARGLGWRALTWRALSSATVTGKFTGAASSRSPLQSLPLSNPLSRRRVLPVNLNEVEAAKKRLPPGLRPHRVERPLTEREALWRQARLLDDTPQDPSLRVSGLAEALTGTTRTVWRAPRVSARQRAYLRRQCLLRGIPWPYDIPRTELGVVIRSEVSARPGDTTKAENVKIATVEDVGAETYLLHLRKGHKWERERARRQALIAERMKGMEQLKQQCRAERRALRLGKVVGGKKPKYDETIELLTRDIKDRELAIPAGMKRRAELVRSLPSRTMRFTEWPLESLIDRQNTKTAVKTKPDDYVGGNP